MEIRSRYPNIQWRKFAGLRDILIHAYFSLENETIWDVIQNKISSLKDKIESYSSNFNLFNFDKKLDFLSLN